MNYSAFKRTIWDYYKKNRRSFPWREHITSYHVVISEVMLQQTQALRVISKFESFIKRFPDFKSLASASLPEVLKEWKGLGYNRRGLNLKRLAEIIVKDHRGKVPATADELTALPGIGKNTAGSILAFAHNIPHPFIETNIRTVFIHFFFKGHGQIADKEILPLVEKTMDTAHPREWYYALMDYGVMLKKLHKNPSRKSLHYRKQSPFRGSNRELRAAILHHIIESPKVSEKKLTHHLKKNKFTFTTLQLEKNISDLTKEGFISKIAKSYKANIK
jgi:A/G-specific adenine glycosylase